MSLKLPAKVEKNEETISVINGKVTKENGKLGKIKQEIKTKLKTRKRPIAKKGNWRTEMNSVSDQSQTGNHLDSNSDQNDTVTTENNTDESVVHSSDTEPKDNLLNKTFPPFISSKHSTKNQNSSAKLNKTEILLSPSQQSANREIFDFFLTPQQCKLTAEELEKLKRKRLTPLLRTMKRERLQSTELMTFKKLRSGSIIKEMHKRKSRRKNVPSTEHSSTNENLIFSKSSLIEQPKNLKLSSDCNENSLKTELSIRKSPISLKRLNVTENTAEAFVNGFPEIQENYVKNDNFVLASNQLENDNKLPNESQENEKFEKAIHDLVSSNDKEVIFVNNIELNSNKNTENDHEMIADALKSNLSDKAKSDHHPSEFDQITVEMNSDISSKVDIIVRDNTDTILDSSSTSKNDANLISKDSNEKPTKSSLSADNMSTEYVDSAMTEIVADTLNESNALCDTVTVANESLECQLLKENMSTNITITLDTENLNQSDEIINKSTDQCKVLDLQLDLDQIEQRLTEQDEAMNCHLLVEKMSVNQTIPTIGNESENISSEIEDVCTNQSKCLADIIDVDTNGIDSVLLIENVCPELKQIILKDISDECNDLTSQETNADNNLVSPLLTENSPTAIDHIAPKLDDLFSKNTAGDIASASPLVNESMATVMDQITSKLDSQNDDSISIVGTNGTMLDTSQLDSTVAADKSSNVINLNSKPLNEGNASDCPLINENNSTELNKTNNLEQNDRVEIDLLKSPSTPSFSAVQRKSRNSLKNLASDLSPKFTEVLTHTEGKLSRYGRLQRYKEQTDFIPSNLIYPARRSKSITSITITKLISPEKLNPHLRMTPPSHHSNRINYISPIDKLINKNKLLSLKYSPNKQNQHDIDPEEDVNRNIYLELPQVSKVLDFDDAVDVKPSSNMDVDINESNHFKLSLNNPRTDVKPQTSKDIAESEQINDIANETELGTSLNTIPGPNDVNSMVEDNSDLTSTLSDSAKGSSIDIDMEQDWKCGYIVWARIGNYPYWPCMVYPDEFGASCVRS